MSIKQLFVDYLFVYLQAKIKIQAWILPEVVIDGKFISAKDDKIIIINKVLKQKL